MARIFALLALAAVSVIVVAVVSNTMGGSTETATRSKHSSAPPPKHEPRQPKAESYVVQPGDTFTGIATEQHISAAKLQRLNRSQGIDPDILQAGQCVNLVPDGCP